jgi:hypothetical protein
MGHVRSCHTFDGVKIVAPRRLALCVVAFDDVCHVVDDTSDCNVDVILALMSRDFLEGPSLLVLGAKETAEDDDVEDDDAVEEEEEDEPEDSHLLPPGEAHVGAFHTTNGGEEERGDESGASPDSPEPPFASLSRRDLFNGVGSLLDLHVATRHVSSVFGREPAVSITASITGIWGTRISRRDAWGGQSTRTIRSSGGHSATLPKDVVVAASESPSISSWDAQGHLNLCSPPWAYSVPISSSSAS